MYRPPGAADREFWLYFGRFLVSKLVRMGPDNPQDSFGPSFRPNRRFSTHFGPNLMFLAPTGTLVSQDLGLAWLWTSPTAAGKPDPSSETSTSVLSQQKTSVLSQHHIVCESRHQFGPKWVENRRFGLKLGPEACQDRSGAFGTGLTHSKGPSPAWSWRFKSGPQCRFGPKS